MKTTPSIPSNLGRQGSSRWSLKKQIPSNLIFILSVMGMFASLVVAQAQPERPNIIIIMADDMGFSDLGCYGGEIETPNLDVLAMNGLRFTQYYNAARCVPTRGSLLTGVYPHQAGVGAMVSPENRPGYRGRLVERVVTLAEVLRGGDYQTFMTGKWHVTHFNYNNPEPTLHRDSWPLQRGFDRFFGHLSGGGSYYDMVSLMKGNEFIQASKDFYLTDAINQYSEQFVREAEADSPFMRPIGRCTLMRRISPNTMGFMMWVGMRFGRTATGDWSKWGLLTKTCHCRSASRMSRLGRTPITKRGKRAGWRCMRRWSIAWTKGSAMCLKP